MRLPLTFYKAGPTDYVVKFVGGVKRSEGKGRIFLVGPRTTLVKVTTTDIPVPFAFTELTRDGQEVVAQGEVHVRLIADRVIARRDFSIDPRTGSYLADDAEAVREEAIHTLQTFVRREVQTRVLKDALTAAALLEEAVRSAIRATPDAFATLGVEVVTLFVTSITPANHDLAKALQAEAREKMLAAADKAIADRRQAAAESDRSLKKFEADTAEELEAKRAKLVAARNANLLAEAAADSEATDKRLTPYRSMDAGTLLALGIKEIASSGRVAQFTITPDLLAAVSAAGKDGNGTRR